MNYKIWNDSNESVPTVYIHSFIGNGEDVWKAAHEINCPPFNLVSIHDFEADSDLSPWKTENVWKGQPPFKGNAEKHLIEIIERLVPKVEAQLPSPSSYVAMAGYSLAGLFTLWSCWHTDRFQRIACISASLWYPGFFDFITQHVMVASPASLYFSLGNKESKTKHPLMRQVEDLTQRTFELVQSLGIPTTFEINPGNHFTDPDKRTARGIQWMLGNPQ